MTTTITVCNSQTRTTCPYCGVGCGVSITQSNGKVAPVSGDTHHPANYGKLCVKGSALHETLESDERLLHPSIGGRQTSWDNALNLISDKITQVINTHGPEAVAIYAAGQILTEDYYVANKLMKGFIGSGNLDTNSRLCMASAVASYKRSLGSDTVPGCYEDLELANMLVLVGSNAAWAHPILYQRMAAAKKSNPGLKVVVIDPRKTATCDLADLHLAIKPGSDAYLFNALLAYMALENGLDESFIQDHTEGFDEAIQQAISEFKSIEQMADQLEVESDQLSTFFQWFEQNPRTVTLYSQGINQSATGTDKGNSIINLHLATGRIGKQGAAPFSITGQPNAMGGREVGGLANQLAAHMDFSAPDRDRIKRFWNAPRLISKPGLKAVDMFDAVKRGEIKFVWIMSTNPLVSMPDADDVKAALAQCELVVVSDCMANTDTTAVADVLLPACGWSEKNGTVTNSERRISRQRSFLPPSGEAKPDWWALTQVAQRMGFGEAFSYQHPSEIFDEHARLTAFENDNSRDLDLSGLVGLTTDQYDTLAPIQWPVNKRYPNGRKRFFEDGHFYTASGKAKFITVKSQLPEPRSEGQLIMNTGRVRDHWHTMTRTALSARLAQHIREPYASIHPADAEQAKVKDGQLIRVFNSRGEILVRASTTQDQRRGEIFIPMHWTSRYASAGRMGSLIGKERDPISGQPELKFAGVDMEPLLIRWHGILLTRQDAGAPPCEYWAYGPAGNSHAYELAGTNSADDLLSWAKDISGKHHDDEWIQLGDPTKSHFRLLLIRRQRIELVLMLHKDTVEYSRQWLLDQFDITNLSDSDRAALIAGQPGGNYENPGKIICSCFTIGDKAIRAAIENGCNSAEALGDRLKCGTNCGSCIPELKELLQEMETTTE